LQEVKISLQDIKRIVGEEVDLRQSGHSLVEGTKERIIQAIGYVYLLPGPSLSEVERADVCISIIVEETDILPGAMIRRHAHETLDSYFGNEGSPTFPRAMNPQ
jgi:hypothetical protein